MKAKDILQIGAIASVLLPLWLFLSKRERAEKTDRINQKFRKENGPLKIAFAQAVESDFVYILKNNTGLFPEIQN